MAGRAQPAPKADEKTVNVVGSAGPGSVPESKLPRALMTGSHEMTSAERAQVLEERQHANDFTERHMAGGVGRIRGLGEAFGLPTDQMITTGASAFGQEDAARAYLSDLQKWHPGASAAGEIAGQVAGTVAGGELLGGGAASRAGSVAGRIAEGAASGALRGGLENLIIGSTHDINEAALGRSDVAGEKLLAQMPKHFALGAVPGAVFGGAGAAIGEAFSAIGQKAPGALNEAANSAIGREFGGDAALGAELRAKVGGVPRSATEVADVLTREQSAFREASAAEAAAARDSLLGRQTTEAWQQTAKTEAARAAALKEGRAELENLAAQHAKAREALTAQAAEAEEAAAKLGAERATAQRQVRNLASDLDKVKGAELPDMRNVMRAASEAFQAEGTLTPPSPNAVRVFSEWMNAFGEKYREPGTLNFTELQKAIKSLDHMETRSRVVSGWGSDPEVKKAFDTLRSAANDEFNRASEATANAVSEAKGLSVGRARETLASVEKAHSAAADTAFKIQESILAFDKAAAGEMTAAQRQAMLQSRAFERGAKGEAKALGQAQRAEEKALPKASKATPVDTLLRKVKAPPAESALAGIAPAGALLSLLHGNVAGAAMSAVGGMAAHTAKAKGNLLAARSLSSLADAIASSDGQIARLGGRAVGRYARQAPEVATEDRPKRKEITFEKASTAVKNAQANPLIIEQRVRSMAGPWAQHAPGVYSAILSASIRMQEFLSSKLPPSRKDPYSLTPHLEADDLSDTEKYDFVQYAKACAAPIDAMKDVIDGKGSPEQVEAVAFVYPNIYKQTCIEVERHIAKLQEPLEYIRAVNIGTLLQIDTNEVMTGEFQTMLADMYSSRAEEEKGPSGSAPRGVNSRLSKSTASAGQQLAAPE